VHLPGPHRQAFTTRTLALIHRKKRFVSQARPIMAPDGTALGEPAEVAIKRRHNGTAGTRTRPNGKGLNKTAAAELARKPLDDGVSRPRGGVEPKGLQANIAAHVDGIDPRGYLGGWAWVPGYPGRAVAVTAYLGEEMVSFGTANSLREDVRGRIR
jgi:hypothetical protein